MLRTIALTRAALTGAVLGLALAASSAAVAQVPLTTELVVQGLSSPTAIAFAPGDSTRLFVTQRSGQVRIVENGTLLATPFLNISSIVQSGGEQGLLGMAFHPDYANNGRFFLNYTTNGGATRVSEFSVSATDPNIANSAVVQIIAAIPQDFSNHNGGCIKFGPDGKLYVGMGDGGSGNDPNNRAQNRLQRLGKMLRYDVDLPAPFIPADNPFVGTPSTLDEIWLIGLRNPWRFSFDRMTGDLWIADVGQSAREEIDFIPAGVGGLNLGWRCKEGTVCTGLSGCSCSDTTLIDPIQEYTHAGGNCSITGGYVYRGSAIPSLAGTYFYADFCSNRIWSIKYDGTNVTDFTDRTTELRPPSGPTITGISSFGEDADGELYILTLSGRMYRIIPEPPACESTSYCQALPTSNGFPASIGTTGTTSLTTNNFGIFASGVPQGQFGLFFYGPGQTQSPSGLGNLCISGSIVRINTILQSDVFGSVFLPIDLTSPFFTAGPAPITPGSTWNFQFWFRDFAPGGGNSWNYTNGTSVLFCN